MASALRVSAEIQNLAVIRRFVEDTAGGLGVDQRAVAHMIQAVDELVANVIIHGYRHQPGVIEVEIVQEGDTLIAHLRDQAPAFDPTTVPSPDLGAPFEKRMKGGLGVYLARSFTDAMMYRRTAEGWNELTLLKRLK